MTLAYPLPRPGLLRRLLCAMQAALTGADAQARQDALARAFRSHGDAVLRAAYAYLHNRSDAEDVAQDTFLQYYDRAPAFESAAHEKAWLLRVAINFSKNKLSSAWFKKTEALDETLPCDDPDGSLAEVWDAVRALPEKYRAPIHLFYHEGYSTAEIARILDRKEATVRSDLRRGREKLRETLKEAYDFDD